LKASALGAGEIIMKPFEFAQLVGAVERALGGDQSDESQVEVRSPS
jgi:FixJ family two-component response regulator